MSDVTVFLGRARRNLNRRISRAYVEQFARRTRHEMEHLGSEHHGWWAPKDMPEGALCYCIGVGLDASFDWALAERGAQVHSFDPTPHSVDYMERKNDGRVTFHQWGVLDEDSSMRLYFPVDERHGSYFATDLHNTGKYHEVPCYRMATILDKLGHDTPFLVKMDIEGSWFEAIPDMLAAGITPEFVQVEFDSPAPVWRVAKVTRSLEAAGYRLVLRKGDNAVFKRV